MTRWQVASTRLGILSASHAGLWTLGQCAFKVSAESSALASFLANQIIIYLSMKPLESLPRGTSATKPLQWNLESGLPLHAKTQKLQRAQAPQWYKWQADVPKSSQPCLLQCMGQAQCSIIRDVQDAIESDVTQCREDCNVLIYTCLGACLANDSLRCRAEMCHTVEEWLERHRHAVGPGLCAGTS